MSSSVDQWIQQPPAEVQAQGFAPAPPGLYSRSAARLASYPNFTLGVVIALVIVVVAMLVYYRGLGPLGPYAGSKPAKARRGRREEFEDDPEPEGDAETERLIESINRQ